MFESRLPIWYRRRHRRRHMRRARAYKAGPGEVTRLLQTALHSAHTTEDRVEVAVEAVEELIDEYGDDQGLGVVLDRVNRAYQKAGAALRLAVRKAQSARL